LFLRNEPLILYRFIFDAFVKSSKTLFSIIPVKTGIQHFQTVTKPLDPVFQRGDGFLQSRQLLIDLPLNHV